MPSSSRPRSTSRNSPSVGLSRDIVGTFDWVRIVPFELDHAIVAGELEASLRVDDTVTRRQIDALGADVLIAGIGRHLDAPVVTRNVDDFERFDGVVVEPY